MAREGDQFRDPVPARVSLAKRRASQSPVSPWALAWLLRAVPVEQADWADAGRGEDRYCGDCQEQR